VKSSKSSNKFTWGQQTPALNSPGVNKQQTPALNSHGGNKPLHYIHLGPTNSCTKFTWGQQTPALKFTWGQQTPTLNSPGVNKLRHSILLGSSNSCTKFTWGQQTPACCPKTSRPASVACWSTRAQTWLFLPCKKNILRDTSVETFEKKWVWYFKICFVY
jgi:hypothetical protein